jgi:hypothetical protein
MVKFFLHNCLLISLFACLLSCNDRTSKTKLLSKENIQKAFGEWQNLKIKNGQFWAQDSCNPNWFSTHNILESPENIKFGFPSDSMEYKFSFGDLNNDNQLDGLVVFEPLQCDGGNLSEWVQVQVFIISNKQNYRVIDSIKLSNISLSNKKSGFYHLDSIGNNKIFGTYLEFKENDGRCCPSIMLPVLFHFMNNTLKLDVGNEVKQK